MASNSSRALTRFSFVKALPPSEGTAMTRFCRPSLGKKERYVPYEPQPVCDGQQREKGRGGRNWIKQARQRAGRKT